MVKKATVDMDEITTVEFIDLKKFYGFTDEELLMYLVKEKYDKLFNF